MEDIITGHDLPGPDTSTHDRTSPDVQFTMTVEQAVQRFAELGHPRNPRSVRRFCQLGKVSCRKVRTSSFTEMYMIDPASVDRYVQELNETIALTGQDMTGHDRPSPDDGQHRQALQSEIATPSRYVTQLEEDVKFLHGQIIVKDEQLKTRDSQITSMIERDRETNILIRGLQSLLRLPERREGNDIHPEEQGQ
jgi:hypothetical protein